VIDNTTSKPGASEVYFSTVLGQTCAGNSAGTGAGAGYCAIQATQSALQ
jgi:hypothetical protein